MDDILMEGDIPEIVHKLNHMIAKTKIFGRLLKLPKSTLDSIHDTWNPDAQGLLFQVIEEFVDQKEPKPTWKNIVEALRHPLMRENNLAREIEEKYCPSASQNGIIVLPL